MSEGFEGAEYELGSLSKAYQAFELSCHHYDYGIRDEVEFIMSWFQKVQLPGFQTLNQKKQ